MPRKPRVFVEGGVYHVYSRFGSGEGVFEDPEEALDFLQLLRFVKKRDGWDIFAWVLMSNHYHLAVRSRAVPISRGFHYLQGRFSQRFNRRRGRSGALWQSRYQARLIDEQGYLGRVVLYIHLNPVAGGLVSDPTDHVFGGHREITRRTSNSIVDIDQSLLCFGETERLARRSYGSAIQQGCRELGGTPAAQCSERIWLPNDRALAPNDSAPYVDVLGRSTGPDRHQLNAAEFVRECAAVLDIEVETVVGRTRNLRAVEARRLLLALGRERWAQSTNELAKALARSADTVTYITREGIARRLEDPGFERMYETLDAELISRGPPRPNQEPSEKTDDRP